MVEQASCLFDGRTEERIASSSPEGTPRNDRLVIGDPALPSRRVKVS